MQYIGRFAPSPSGDLHFGSLIAALGSYLQAKAHQGQWLVRIEDIDPPREIKGSADRILFALEAYGLEWDGQVLYQHTRLDAYRDQIETWLAQNEAYYCSCTRKEVKAMGGIYQSQCRHKKHHDMNLTACGIRVIIDHPVVEFEDRHHGRLQLHQELAAEDFIIQRRDGLFAYNLAVVLDDIEQGVTEIVRGADLIEPTGRQMSLYKKLGYSPIRYLHLPLALNAQGHKLSKQNHAPAIDVHNPTPALIAALDFLGHSIPIEMQGASVTEILAWAKEDWHIKKIPQTTSVITAF